MALSALRLAPGRAILVPSTVGAVGGRPLTAESLSRGQGSGLGGGDVMVDDLAGGVSEGTAENQEMAEDDSHSVNNLGAVDAEALQAALQRCRSKAERVLVTVDELKR